MKSVRLVVSAPRSVGAYNLDTTSVKVRAVVVVEWNVDDVIGVVPSGVVVALVSSCANPGPARSINSLRLCLSYISYR